MVQKGDTVQVHVDIAKDGSGHSLSRSHSTLKAYVINPPEETHWGKYHLLVPMDELIDHLRKTDTEIREDLIMTEELGHEGYKVVAAEMYVEE